MALAADLLIVGIQFTHLTDLGVQLAVRASGVLTGGGIPAPGIGTPPPGSKNITQVLSWIAWCVCGLCVTGVLVVAGRMAVQHNRGEGGQHALGLAYVLGACILVGAGSGIVGALT
jgi:hypothetical protein